MTLRKYLPSRKAVTIALLFLCVEAALIDSIMDMQQKEEADSQRWTAALINMIEHKE